MSMMHRLLHTWALSVIAVQGLRMQNEAFGEGELSELDGKESATKGNPWQALTALLLAFGPSTSEALAFGPGTPRTGLSHGRTGFSHGLSSAVGHGTSFNRAWSWPASAPRTSRVVSLGAVPEMDESGAPDLVDTALEMEIATEREMEMEMDVQMEFERWISEAIHMESMLSRRDAILTTAVAAAILAPRPASAETFEEFMAAKENKDKKPGVGMTTRADLEIQPDGIFGTPLYLVLRVREATEQQERLVRSGKYKDLQRANIKMAVSMMLTNYNLERSIKQLVSTLPKDKRQTAEAKGREAIESLMTLNSYFDTAADSLNVASLTPEKKEFILKAFASTREKLDQLLQYAPSDTLEEARAFIVQENAENVAAMKESGQSMLNPPSLST